MAISKPKPQWVLETNVREWYVTKWFTADAINGTDILGYFMAWYAVPNMVARTLKVKELVI